ncbi:response regulator [Chloroflexota bacterium]
MERRTVLEEEKIKGGANMKPILIVEDEAIMRESLRDWLTDSGYQVETAENGEEALQTVAEHDFDIAILDLRLPGKDGIEVLREAKEKRPQLKGVIITAYPSVQTAVEAIKEGAIEYLPKPFDLNELEKIVQQTLGPVQVEIRPKAVTEETIAEPTVVEEAKVEEVIAIAPDEIAVHVKHGKAHFEAGRYQEALKEFEAILKATPGNIETRVWVGRTTKALSIPEIEGIAGEARPKYCVWVSLGMVSYRICTNDYNCMSCEFDQEMQEKMAAGGGPELEEALARLKELPGNQRLCRYALKGDVSHRICSRLFQCATCEFGQMMDDALQQMLAQRAVELAARQEALHKKRQSWWWPYWEPKESTGVSSYSSN